MNVEKIKAILQCKKSLMLVNFLFVLIILGMLLYAVIHTEEVQMTIIYGETHSEDSTATVYWTGNKKDGNEDQRSVVNLKNGQEVSVYIDLNYIGWWSNQLIISPIDDEENISIKSFVFSTKGEVLEEFTGEDIEPFIRWETNLSHYMDGDHVSFVIKDEENRFVLPYEFNREIASRVLERNLRPFWYLIILYLFLGMAQLVFTEGRKLFEKKGNRIITASAMLIPILALLICFLLYYSKGYLLEHFADVSLAQLLYHLHTPLDGTNVSSFEDAFMTVGIASVSIIVGVIVLYLLLKRFKRSRLFLTWLAFGCLIAIGYQMMGLYFQLDVPKYLKFISDKTTIYEEEYVDGKEAKLSFPEKKCNLIYIFLESMETTYADEAHGGAMEQNYIPELTGLISENECFGDGDQLNGGYVVPGAGFTMGALVAQTSGVPINESLVGNDTLNSSWESDNNYVLGVWAIGDILKEQGYHQEFLIGSEAKFAGRSSYFKGHGDYQIFDYYTAKERNLIPQDYHVWWGYEDEKLFSYARSELTEFSKSDGPFNLTLLTVDTHFTDGYWCELCEDLYEDQYSNVIACSSRQVADFVKWVQEQDFYDDTVIVLAGDHLTMDSGYMKNHDVKGYDRRTLFTIINGHCENQKKGEERLYTTLDLFPTTLAALGVKIDGDRLGLGTNLYSGKETLLEKYGGSYLNEELAKDSKYYKEKILYAN